MRSIACGIGLVWMLLCPVDALAMQNCPIPVAPASASLTDASKGGEIAPARLDGCPTDPDPRPNPLPTVSLTAPASGASAYAPGSFGLAASASDANGVANVEFKANGTLLYRDSTAPYAYNWTNVGIGSYALQAIAHDNRGGTKASATRTVTVKAMPTVKGYIDGVFQNSAGYYIRGWACATTLPQSINVDLYAGGAAGSGTGIGRYTANVSSETAVASACQSTGTKHRFSITLSTAIRQQHAGKKIYVHGISPVGGSHNLLVNSGTFAVPPPPPPNSPPTITLITPTDGVYVYEPGSFNLTASASAASGIAHVDFKASGTLLHRDTTAPYAYVWERAAAGSYILQAVAYDKLGASTTSPNRWVHVKPQPVGNAASARIVTPGAAGNYVPGASVTVQSNARALHDGVELRSHRIYHNGAVVASADIAVMDGMHSLTKVVSGLTTGLHDFASATTTTAGTYTSAVVTITVSHPPVVTLTSPANGASYSALGTITLKANASDADGSVSKVEFYNGSTLLATDTTAPYAYNWTGVPGSANQYALHAKAYGNLGKSSSSAVHNITVNAHPTVSVSRSPSFSILTAPADVTLTASAADSDGSVSKVEFYNGSTRLATDTVAPYSHSLPGLTPGSYSFTAKAYDNRGAVTASAADSLAVLIRGSSPVVVSRRYIYDSQHRLCKTIEPETGASIVEYDDAGNVAWTASGQPLLSTTDCQRANVPLVERVARQYDNRNRVRVVDFPDNRGNSVYTYTPDGLIESFQVDNGGSDLVTTSYAYNRRRLIISERLQHTIVNWPIAYVYNANGDLAFQQWHGLNIDYAPNALGQPTRVGSYATGVSYHPNGAVKQFTYGNGIVHTLLQNARGLPERSRDAHDATVVHDDSVDYDFNGNVAAISDGLAGQVGNRTMTYDGLGRLVQVISPMFGGDNKAVFGYDAIDNLLYARVGDKSEAYYYYDDSNHLTNVSNGDGQTIVGLGYDARGNVANKSGQLFDFDYGNRLRGITGTASYVYDGLGRRVRDTSGASKYSQYNHAGRLTMTGDNRSGTVGEYFYLGDSLVAIRDRDVSTNMYTTKYQHTDALGSPVVVTDESRQALERNRYAPYGAQIDGSVKDGPGYTGHVMDQASGLTYMQQRYYDPSLGRFLSVDPVIADSNTGSNFNRYWYADNNPYKFIDPDGRQAFCNGSRICRGPSTGARSVGPVGDVSQSSGRRSISVDLGKPTEAIAKTIVKYDLRTFGAKTEYAPQFGDQVEGQNPNPGGWLGIGPLAFASESKLAGVIAHEGRHELQFVQGRVDNDRNGFAANEAEAYKYNLTHAKRFGNSPAEISDFRKNFHLYYDGLPKEYKREVDSLDYSE